MEGLEVVVQQITVFDEEDGMALLKAINRLASKLEPIETRGLPEDLKKAFEEARESWTKVAECMNDSPFPLELAYDEEAIQTWSLAQIEKDSEFFAKFAASYPKWQKDSVEAKDRAETAAQDLEVVFKKHKIDVDFSGLW